MQHVKHITSTVIIGLSLSFPVHSVVSPDGMWSDSLSRSLVAKEFNYRSVTTSVEELVNQLKSAPLEGTGVQGLEFFLPLPSGKFERVSVFESPIMAPELAAKLPSIKTYKVTGLDNPQVSGRLDASPEGFHGYLNTDQGVIYIEPESSYSTSKSSGIYRSFNKSSFPVSKHDYKCSVIGHDHSDNAIESLGRSLPQVSAMRSSGSAVRTYRLALAATAEYTAAVSSGTPTVAKGQAAIVTAVNRINAIYEKEVAIKFVLVDNSNIVFTNSATDGYTNNNGISLLSENKAKLDAVINSANYDIGHVFSTGGGGVASLASVCDDASKAQGVTGSWDPVGDPFVVDYVAHEIGHQFGAPHTFNAGGNNSGSCDNDNRENHQSNEGGTQLSDSAYEPGSGSTIMAYAGICDPQNIQNNSDPYFHARSLEQIREFVENEIPFSNTQGGSCGTNVLTGNTAPSAEAGDNYVIPANTPFALTGSGDDVDANDVASLNYTWEQFDLGSKTTNLTQMHTDSDTRPIIRSRQGTDSPTRFIPALDAILENNLTKHTGERLPTTDRDMTFRLTVRSGSSGFNQDDMTVTVDKDAGPLVVNEPAAQSAFTGKSKIDVRWDVANTQSAPVNCSHMSILFSSDGGENFDETLAASTSNDGFEIVELPNISTDMGRIKVQCVDNIFFNVSPGNFMINKAGSLDISSVPTDSTEGDSESTPFTFTITRSDITTGTSSVFYAVTGTGTNPAGATDFIDNIFPSGTVNFEEGITSKTITINVAGDTDFEPDESFVVTLANPISSFINIESSTAIIINDDVEPPANLLDISSVAMDDTEGNSGTTPYTFRITRSNISIGTSSVFYAVTGTGTNPAGATDFIDNIFPSGTVIFEEGITSKTITINVAGDTDFEPDENFVVTLANPVSSLINTGSAGAIIINDDIESKANAEETSFVDSGSSSGGGSGGLMFFLLPILLTLRKRK